MKQIPSTLYLFLRQEWITVSVYCIATLLFFVIIFAGGHESSVADQSHHQFITIFMIAMLSIFVGLYLGSGFLRLKQSHLWKTLPSYKNTLVASFVVAAFIYGIVQSIPMFYASWHWPIALLAPPAITLLTAQAVIGNNFIMKVILPISPFVLFQLTNFEISQSLILGMLLLITGLAIYLNYTNNNIENTSTIGLMSGNLEKQLKSPSLQKVNGWIGDIFTHLGFKSRASNLLIALMRPNSRFGIASILGSTLSLLFFYSMGDDKIELEGLAAFMLVSILLGVFIELKMLAKQCKPFAHLYSNDNYWLFKSKIVRTLQRYMLIQSSIYIGVLGLFSLCLANFIDFILLARYVLTFTVVGIFFLPAFLSVNWFSVNFKLLGVVLVYIGMSIVLCGWFYDTQSLTNLYFQLGLSALALVAVAVLARVWWKKQPIETFLRAHG